MSQQRVRKPVVVGDTLTRSSVVKAAGDTVPCPRRNNERGRSKNKIPKSIRYDLESALVSLCDVWFEEIKPHLIRNNIKLHVDGMGGAAGSAGGDQAPAMPPDIQASSCDHLDPGAASDRRRPWAASSAGSCSTPPTVSRAPSLKQPAMSPSTHLQALTTRNLISLNKNRRGRSIKRKPSSDPASLASPLSWRTVRACRTYSLLRDTPATTAPPPSEPASAPAKPTSPRVLARYASATQVDSNYRQPQTTNIHRNNRELKKRRKARKCSKLTQTDVHYSPKPTTPVSKRNSSIQCDRCPAKTAINKKTQEKLQPDSDTARLYDSNLVDLIAELEDKRLHMLYQSPRKDEFPSAMNLLQLPYAIPTMRRRKTRKLKLPPWK